MDSSVLPENWAAVTLEAVAEVHDNLREPVNSTERKGRIGPFPYYGATGQVGWIDDFRQDGEYVLLGEDGAPFFDFTKDKAYLVSGKCWVNNHAHVLKGRDGVCLNRYLLYALNQVNYRGYANGTTRLKLTQAAMRQLPINLAPLAEQHRIVAKIEELFSELDQGVASLKTAREQLKVYRQSLLKNAFEGKLTAAWRAAHRDQLETAAALQQRIARERQARYQQQLADWQTAGQAGPKPKPPKPLPPLTAEELTDLPELPAGWGWIKLGATNVEVFDGPFGSNLKSSDYVSDGVRVIRLENIGGMEFIEDKLSFITPEKYRALEKHTVFPGDLVFSSFVTENVRVAMVPPSVEKAVNKADCFCIRFFGESILNGFALSFLGTRLVYKRLEEEIHGVGRPRINTTQLKNVAIPVCSADEQRELVALVHEKLSEADQLDQTLATALQQADALRQSILKKAFHGQLEKQAKNEEPAAALLERIRAGKSNGIKKPVKQGKAG